MISEGASRQGTDVVRLAFREGAGLENRACGFSLGCEGYEKTLFYNAVFAVLAGITVSMGDFGNSKMLACIRILQGILSTPSHAANALKMCNGIENNHWKPA